MEIRRKSFNYLSSIVSVQNKLNLTCQRIPPKPSSPSSNYFSPIFLLQFLQTFSNNKVRPNCFFSRQLFTFNWPLTQGQGGGLVPPCA